MPKKKKQAPKQANIKEMFVNKRRAEMVVADDNEDYKRIKISPYLLISNDITQETDYPVSIMAKVYFREHSNINEVLDRYLEREKRTNVDKDTFLSTIIRHAISYKRFKRDYPFNLFAFESDYHECIGKFLLKHYEIKTNEDLRDANIFLAQENLMHCQISMDLNNKFRSDEQEYINRKREKIGYQHVKPFLQIGTNHALRKYKEDHNLLEKYHIKDMSLEDMCRVTNIERLTRIEMDKKKIPKSSYDECLEGMFEAFKKNPSLAITNEKFYVFPHYLFIINDLTPEQEFLVTERKDRFYAYTNAKDLLAINKKHIHLPNESTDPVVNRNERRRLFYLKYIRMIDKKQAPFNYLLWTKEENSDPESNPNKNRVECENQPGPSSVTSNVWKKKQVAEKNDFVLPSQVNPPNNNDQFNKENTLIGHRLARNPKDYIKFQQYNSKYAEIIAFLLKEKEFIDELKKEIIKDPICAKMWNKNNHLILWNCLHYNFEDRNEFFLNLLMNCQIGDKAKLIEMLRNADIDVNGTESIGNPIATSTQTIEIPFIQESTPKSSKNQQKRPFQCSNNSDDILVMNNQTPELQLPTNIKQEPISEQFVENSDVQIVPVDVTDVVSISDEEDVITGNNRVMPEKKAMDVYQQNLNMESQANNETNDDHENLEAEYGLVGHRIATRNVTNRRRNSRLIYESETTSSNDNNNARN